jgi:signal transduction histidine kinase
VTRERTTPEPLSVLCVENGGTAEPMARSLERREARVRAEAASSVEAAIEHLESDDYDVVVARGDDRRTTLDRVRSSVDATMPYVVVARGDDGADEAVAVAPVGDPDGDTDPTVSDLARTVAGLDDEANDADARDTDKLHALHSVTADVEGASTVDEACRRTIDAAAEVLEFEMCNLAVFENGALRPEYISEDAPSGGVRPFAPGEGVAGEAYVTGESSVVDDVVAYADADPVKASYRSALTVPIGDWGVFQAVATSTGAFDETDRDLAELLIAHTQQVLERLERERELREREARLERQNERLERFASVVSHDLRNPLTIARGYLDPAMETGNQTYFEEIRDALDRMERLVDDVLTLARRGEVVEETEPVGLRSVTCTAAEDVPTPDTDLDVTVDGDATVDADPERLRQLFENLLRNAVEHGATDGAVRVTVGVLGTRGFFVADDGPGVPESDREAVFNAGYSTTDDGTGLGLNIVADIAEAHGWSVDVTENENGGARFEVTGVDLDVTSNGNGTTRFDGTN